MTDEEIEQWIKDEYEMLVKKIENYYKGGKFSAEDRYWVYNSLADKLNERANEL